MCTNTKKRASGRERGEMEETRGVLMEKGQPALSMAEMMRVLAKGDERKEEEEEDGRRRSAGGGGGRREMEMEMALKEYLVSCGADETVKASHGSDDGLRAARQFVDAVEKECGVRGREALMLLDARPRTAIDVHVILGGHGDDAVEEHVLKLVQKYLVKS